MRLPAWIVAATVVCGLPTAASAASVLPDLVSDPPVHQGIETRPGSPNRLLLRMDGYVHNAGLGPLDIAGDPRAGTVVQRLLQSGTNTFTNGRSVALQFENSDGHNHWHLMRASEYSLWNLARTAQVAPAAKIGFCLYDLERIERNGPSRAVYDGSVIRNFCEQGNPQATAIRMGVSAGWRDIYGAFLELQWVDVSNTSPGEYRLAARVDPQNAIEESREDNNGLAFASSTSVVPGYVAQPVGPVAVPSGQPVTVTLASTTFSRGPDANVEARQFVVKSPPAHGVLSVATNATFTQPSVIYTPTPGYAGTDTFTYEARDAGSAFPRTPPTATVSLSVAGAPPTVTISGSPASVVAGTSVQLTATVTSGGVEWLVDGVPGGNATVGTISPAGLYTAPALPRTVTITARSQTAPTVSASVAVTVIAATIQTPLPDPSTPQPSEPVATVAPKLRQPYVADGRVTIVAQATAKGTARLEVRDAADTLLLDCTMPVRRGRLLTCSRKVKSTGNLTRMTATGSYVDPAASPGLASRPQLEVRNGMLIARTVAGRAGVIDMRFMRGNRQVLRCAARVPAGRPLSCSTPVAKGVTVKSIRVSVTHTTPRVSAIGRY